MPLLPEKGLSTQSGLELTSAGIARQELMDRTWKVVKRIGRRMTLECGQEQRLIREPSRPYAKQLFHMARPGQVIDEETVELLIIGKVKKHRMKISKGIGDA